MTVLQAEGVSSYGTTSLVLAPTIADPETEVSVAEATGVGTVNASCYTFGDFMVTTTASKVQKDRRSCQTRRRETFGEKTTTVTAVQYIEGPQDSPSADINKVKTAIPEGTEIWIIERRGLPAETEPIVLDDIVNLHLVVMGPANRTKSSDGDGGEFTITQEAVHVESYYDIPVVA